MIEMNSQRKNKINLSDYNYRKDIENRLLMAQLSTLDLEVLEEILYSSIHISIRKLAKSIDVEEEEILPTLEKLSKTSLITIQGDSIVVNKEMRKYYESQIVKFDEDFQPGMEFLQGLLKKVPIHVLPTWYSIPRTSNNIFDSLVEKYLFTPQIFQRYLMEFNASDPNLAGIIHDVFHSKDFQVPSQELIDKYGFSREQFEEYMLHLEFNFICCLGYQKVGRKWQEIVTPFSEWRDYMHFLRSTEPQTIDDKQTPIQRYRPNDFSFIQDLAAVLNLAKKQPFVLIESKSLKQLLPNDTTLAAIAAKCEGTKVSDPHFNSYVFQLISKLRMLKLADIVDGRLYALESANDWLDMRLENRALYIYRHPLNRLLTDHLPGHICTERNIREAEKSVMRVLNAGWVYFDDFIKGALVVLSEESTIVLKRIGKTWKYTLPIYTQEEQDLIKATIFEWLFEMGVVSTGTHKGKDCFYVTAFGQSLFGR